MGSDNCWLYARSLTKAGYGMTWDGSKTVYAHRVMYIDRHGSIPVGAELDHLCRNRSCVNPDHLDAVSHKENVMRGEAVDKFIRHWAFKTHCVNGHEFTAGNTYTPPKRPTNRHCKQCLRHRSQKLYQRRKDVERI